MTNVAGAALAVAAREIGVREVPPGSNRGPRVESYLASVGLPGGFPWCAAFVHWCFGEAARAAAVANPFPATGGCLEAWRLVAGQHPARTLPVAVARAHPALVRPGAVFVLDLGHGEGHVGLVEAIAGEQLTTVEGNTNPAGGAEGIGVFRLARRRLGDAVLHGFLDFTGE